MTRLHHPEAAPRPPGRPAPPDTIEPLLTITTLAAYLAVDARTVHRMLAAGKLPGPDLRVGIGPRGAPRWRRSTIDRWVESGVAHDDPPL